MSQTPGQPPTLPLRPVIELGYALPRKRRPGLLTATGVLSIIVASQGILANGMSVIQMVFFYYFVRSLPAPATPVVFATTGPTGVAEAAGPPMISMPPLLQSPFSTLLFGTTSLLCFGLAIYLLVAGILLLRDRPRSHSMHFRYAVIKIPAALLAGLGYGLWFSDFILSATSGGDSPQMIIFWIMGAIWALVGCLYPIALLIALRSREIREYYSGLAAPSE